MPETIPYTVAKSAGGIFKDVYKRSADLAKELEARRADAHGERSGEQGVPGTALEIRRKARNHNQHMPGGLGGSSERESMPTAIIAARHKGRRINLLALAMTADSDAPASRAPATVNGYRDTELGGYYWLTREDSGLIRARLGTPTATDRTEEPLIGDSVFEEPGQRLREMSPQNRERLQTVTAGIMSNLAAIELLMDGGPVETVLEARLAD